jgi:UPF0148 protein
MLGSLLISSSIDMAEAALTASFTLSSMRMALMFSAERRMFLGTASSLMMRSNTSTHCLRTFSAVVESPPALEDGKKVNDNIRPIWLCSDDIVVVFKRMWHSQFAVKFMDEDEMLKRRTKLREQGCTMLASHHDCGAPLFRCKGEIICPACSPEGDKPSALSAKPVSDTPLIQGEMEKPGGPSKSSIQSAPQASETKASTQDQLVRAEELLRQALLHRLKELTEGVESEGDLDKLSRQLDCIEGILRILSALER